MADSLIPEGFEIEQEIPEGFEIDNSSIPEGFEIENTQGTIQQPKTQPNQAEIDRINSEYEARNREIDAEHRKNMARIGLGGAISAVGGLPILNIPYVGTGIGGALIDAGNAIMEGDKLPDIAKRAGRGFVLGETIGAIPYVGKLAGRTKIGQTISKPITSVASKVINKVAETPIAQKVGQVLTKERQLPFKLETEAKILTPEEVVQFETIQDNGITHTINKQNGNEVGYIDSYPYNDNFRQSKLAQASGLPEELQGLAPEYQVIKNKDLINNAMQELETKGVNDVASELRNIDEPTALDFEKARQTVDKLFADGRVNEAMEIIEQISEKGSKAGQAVQAMSLWQKTTPAGAVKTAQNIINKYNKTVKNKIPELSEQQANEVIELTKKIQTSAEGREKDVATAQLMKYFGNLVPSGAGDKIKTLRNMSLLLNPKTFTRNITGNAIFAGMENALTKPVAAGVDKVASLVTKQRTRTLPQVSDYARGLYQGTKEGIEDVALGIDTRKGIGERFNLPQKQVFSDTPVLGGLEKALDYSLRVPDRAFYQAAFNESLANQMKAAGIKEATPEMLKIANNEALESVYQNNSGLGKLATGARRALNDLGDINGFGLGDALIPYAQTPANVAQQGINYSPFGIVNAINNFSQGNQRQATLDLARSLVGTGLMGAGYGLAKSGVINNDIDNYEALQNYQAMGIRPNTINLPNGYNMSYNQLQPLSAPISGGVALANAQNGDYMKALDASLGSVADLSMLRGVNDFMKDYNDKGLATATANLALGIPSQFVPTSLNQITSYLDNVQRETYDPNPAKQAMNKIVARIPSVSKTLPAKYDVTGNVIKKNETEGLQRAFDTFINPVFVNKRKDDPTLQELTRIFEQTDDKAQLLPVVDKKVKFTDISGNKVNRTLSGEELSRYQQQIGTVNKKVLDNFVNSQFYNMLDDEQKVNEIAKIQRQVKQKVDEELFNKPNPKLRNMIRKLMPTQQDKIVGEVLKIYNNQILQPQIESVYQQNF